MRGEHPHATGLKRWGEKKNQKKESCKTQHVLQERSNSKGMTETAEESTAKTSWLGISTPVSPKFTLSL